jgi:hypothetical protein
MRFAIRRSGVWGPLFSVLGMSGKSSFVEIDTERRTLHVKGGIWFEETFQLDEIESVSPSTWPWWGGLGVKLGPGNSVGVVASGEGVVAIKFRRPQLMHVIVSVERPELRVSLEDPDGFMRELRSAARLAAA